MPISREIGIRPGHGKKANEFDVLDAEDAAIAAAEEAKAQAGIPVGSDHPRTTSNKDVAMRASKKKAARDLLVGDEKAKALRKFHAEVALREQPQVRLCVFS